MGWDFFFSPKTYILSWTQSLLGHRTEWQLYPLNSFFLPTQTSLLYRTANPRSTCFAVGMTQGDPDLHQHIAQQCTKSLNFEFWWQDLKKENDWGFLFISNIALLGNRSSSALFSFCLQIDFEKPGWNSSVVFTFVKLAGINFSLPPSWSYLDLWALLICADGKTYCWFPDARLFNGWMGSVYSKVNIKPWGFLSKVTVFIL